MPPELRKRKAPAGESVAAPPTKKKGPVAKAVAKVKEALSSPAKTTSAKVAVGDTIDFEGFGGDIETNDGVKTTLKKLVDESKGGVVLFTYPKASTPGCKFCLPWDYERKILNWFYRHKASLSIPRFLYLPHFQWFLYLRPLHG